MTAALDIALGYIGRGWNPVPIPFRKKGPTGDGWQRRIIDAASAAQFFNGGSMNIGVVLGPSSRGLTDVDLDTPEAIFIGPFVLPKTGAIFGRASKRASHREYVTNLASAAEKVVYNFDDPITKTRLLELRVGGSKGAQTIFPGSTHEEGEAVTWDEDGEPTTVDGAELFACVRELAAHSLLARYWPPAPLPGQSGTRHQCALVLGGFLARTGRTNSQIKIAAEAITRAAGDEEWKDRRKAAGDAAEAYRNGERTYGLRTLREIFPRDVAIRVAEWLDYRSSLDEEPAREEPTDDASERADEPLPRMQWMDLSNWDNEPRPQREWAIRDRVPLKQVGLFSGEGGTGKSILEMTKDVAHVNGSDWLGCLPERRPAFYLGAEDDENEIHIRFYDIAAHYRVTFAELVAAGLYVRCLFNEDATLCTLNRDGKVEVTNLYRQLYQEAGDIKPINISIDTLTHAFVGSELDRVQVYAFAMHMRRLAKVANGSVTVLSHPSLQGMASGSGISGSTAWHNAFRFRMYLRGVKDAASGDETTSKLRELEFKKNQYGPLGETVTLEFRNGLYLPIHVIGGLEKVAADQAMDNLFLEMIEKLQQQGRNVSHNKTAHNYAPKEFTTDPKIAKMPDVHKGLAQAMQRLFAAKRIFVETYGPPSRSHTRIAVVKMKPEQNT